MRKRFALLLAPVVLVLTGCATMVPGHSATPVPDGFDQVGAVAARASTPAEQLECEWDTGTCFDFTIVALEDCDSTLFLSAHVLDGSGTVVDSMTNVLPGGLASGDRAIETFFTTESTARTVALVDATCP